MMAAPLNNSAALNDVHSPFNLDEYDLYARWRKKKLAAFSSDVESLLVPVEDPDAVRSEELASLKNCVIQRSLALYQIPESTTSKASIRALASAVGLTQLDNNLCSDEDSITSIQIAVTDQQKTYIPYTNRRLSWHTDGYYNTLDKQIRGMMLHCVRPAARGGENMLLDHEMAYIQIRDENPAFIQALMHPDAMLIPPNNEGGEEIRGAQSGPVFSLEKGSGNLHMRYSARTRNIVWRDDAVTQQAVQFISQMFDSSPYIIRHRMQAGQGLICNNVLHNRTSFEDTDEQKRLLYRARFYDRVSDTDVNRLTGMVN